METKVIVADNARARIFTSDSVIKKLQEIESFAHPEAHLSNRELVGDASGKSVDQRGSLDPATSATDHEAESFARLLGNSEIVPILQWLSLLILLTSWQLVPEALLRKELRFGAISRSLIASIGIVSRGASARASRKGPRWCWMAARSPSPAGCRPRRGR